MHKRIHAIIIILAIFVAGCGTDKADATKSLPAVKFAPQPITYTSAQLAAILPDQLGVWQGDQSFSKDYEKDGKHVSHAARGYTNGASKAVVELMDAGESPDLLTPFSLQGSDAGSPVTLAGQDAKVMYEEGGMGALVQIRDKHLLVKVTAHGLASKDDLLALGNLVITRTTTK